MHPKLNIALNATRLAAKRIQHVINQNKDVQFHDKGHNDFVTEIDLAVEQILIEQIQEAFPDHGFISEEQGEIPGKDPDHVWIIDPIDGTRNFLHRLPNFVIAIAHQYKGVLEQALIYHPLTNDLWTASKGEGTQLNGKRVRVSGRNKLDGGLLSTSLHHLGDYTETQEALIPEVRTLAGIRHSGSSSLDMAYIASGYLDVIWQFNTKLWDIAPGALLIKEAGGLITDIHGGLNHMKHGCFVAGTPKVVKEVLQRLRPKLQSHMDEAK